MEDTVINDAFTCHDLLQKTNAIRSDKKKTREIFADEPIAPWHDPSMQT